MNNRIYPCTAADPMGVGPQEGLLGEGELPWPHVVAARAFPQMLDVGGLYSVSDVDAAEFILAELSDPDREMTSEEAETYVVSLIKILQRLKSAGSVAGESFSKLQGKAEAIPYIGPVLFSTSNLPGALTSAAAMLHAGSQSLKLRELIDLTPDTSRRLDKWIAGRGKAGSTSARKAFRGRIKLVEVRGVLFFEMPLGAKATLYRWNGSGMGNSVNIAVHEARKNLRKTVFVDGKQYSSRGVGRYLTGTKMSGALAFGPQAVIDGLQSSSVGEFVERSAYSQPSNAAAFAAATLTGAVVGGPAVLVVALSLAAGAFVQFVLSDDVSGWSHELGDFLTGKD